jgi:hypothetical protein
MRLLVLLAISSLVIGCATATHKETFPAPADETYFSVIPTVKTQVITFHVQLEKFSPNLKSEFERALVHFADKCWLWGLPSYRESAEANDPKYCLKFVNFTEIRFLKPYKREPTDKKMLLTALDQEGSIQVQNFVWDGEKLQRVRNSDSKLRDKTQDRATKFMMSWALK